MFKPHEWDVWMASSVSTRNILVVSYLPGGTHCVAAYTQDGTEISSCLVGTKEQAINYALWIIG